MFYSSQRRPEVKTENVTLTLTLTFDKITRIVVAEWEHMNVDEKEIYQRIADKDKERYENEMKVYNALNKVQLN